jgi:hypothetical protein
MPTQAAYPPELSPTDTLSPGLPCSSPTLPTPERVLWQLEVPEFSLQPSYGETIISPYDAPWVHDYEAELNPTGLFSNGDFDITTIAPASVGDDHAEKAIEWDFSSLNLERLPQGGQDPLNLYFVDPSVISYY